MRKKLALNCKTMTKHFVLSAVAAASTLLGGCSLIPAYERPAAPVPAHYAQTAPTAQPAQESTAAQPAPAWQSYFTDTQLQALITLALANNRDLRVATLNLEKARAQFQIQRSALLPQLSAQGNATRGNSETTGELGNTFVAGLAIPSWELDFFGRIRSLKSAALAQYFATDEARQAYELALVASVAQGWLTLLADEELLDLSSRTLATRQESMRLTQLRFDSGVSSELDLRQAESLVEAARATTAQQQRQRAQDENALVLLLGQELPESARAALAHTRLASTPPMADVPAGLPSDLLTHRPDIRQAEQQLLAANANIGAARAAFFPSISLTGQYGSVSRELSDLFQSGSWGFNVGAGLNLPIFTAGRNMANLRAAKVDKDIAIAQYEKAIQVGFKEVSDALAGRNTLREQAQAQTAQANAERRRLELADLRYRNGVASYLDLLDAQRSLFALEQADVQTRLLQQINQIQLYKALGGGWNTPTTATHPTRNTPQQG